MATPAEIREMAARKLGILGYGQTLSAEYTTTLTEAFDAVFYGLREDGYNTWAYTAEVPDSIADHFALLVSARRCLEVGASAQRVQTIKGEEPMAMREVKKHLASRFVSTKDAVDY